MSSSNANTSVLDVVVNSDQVAVGIMAHMLNTANKRGAFSLDESGKIMEALQYLRGPAEQQQEAAAQQQQPESQQAAAAPAAAPAAPAKPTLN